MIVSLSPWARHSMRHDVGEPVAYFRFRGRIVADPFKPIVTDTVPRCIRLGRVDRSETPVSKLHDDAILPIIRISGPNLAPGKA